MPAGWDVARPVPAPVCLAMTPVTPALAVTSISACAVAGSCVASPAWLAALRTMPSRFRSNLPGERAPHRGRQRVVAGPGRRCIDRPTPPTDAGRRGQGVVCTCRGSTARSTVACGAASKKRLPPGAPRWCRCPRRARHRDARHRACGRRGLVRITGLVDPPGTTVSDGPPGRRPRGVAGALVRPPAGHRAARRAPAPGAARRHPGAPRARADSAQQRAGARVTAPRRPPGLARATSRRAPRRARRSPCGVGTRRDRLRLGGANQRQRIESCRCRHGSRASPGRTQLGPAPRRHAHLAPARQARQHACCRPASARAANPDANARARAQYADPPHHPPQPHTTLPASPRPTLTHPTPQPPAPRSR